MGNVVILPTTEALPTVMTLFFALYTQTKNNTNFTKCKHMSPAYFACFFFIFCSVFYSRCFS